MKKLPSNQTDLLGAVKNILPYVQKCSCKQEGCEFNVLVKAIESAERIAKAGRSKEFLDRAEPMEGRIKKVVDHLMFSLVVKFPLLSNKARKLVADELDTAYRLAHKDGVTDERRNIERYLKVVL